MSDTRISEICNALKTATDTMTSVIKQDPKRLYNPSIFCMTWGIYKAATHAVTVANVLNDSDLSEKLTDSINALVEAGHI